MKRSPVHSLEKLCQYNFLDTYYKMRPLRGPTPLLYKMLLCFLMVDQYPMLAHYKNTAGAGRRSPKNVAFFEFLLFWCIFRSTQCCLMNFDYRIVCLFWSFRPRLSHHASNLCFLGVIGTLSMDSLNLGEA